MCINATHDGNQYRIVKSVNEETNNCLKADDGMITYSDNVAQDSSKNSMHNGLVANIKAASNLQHSSETTGHCHPTFAHVNDMMSDINNVNNPAVEPANNSHVLVSDFDYCHAQLHLKRSRFNDPYNARPNHSSTIHSSGDDSDEINSNNSEMAEDLPITCSVCLTTCNPGVDAAECTDCGNNYHLACNNMTTAQVEQYLGNPITQYTCSSCEYLSSEAYFLGSNHLANMNTFTGSHMPSSSSLLPADQSSSDSSDLQVYLDVLAVEAANNSVPQDGFAEGDNPQDDFPDVTYGNKESTKEIANTGKNAVNSTINTNNDSLTTKSDTPICDYPLVMFENREVTMEAANYDKDITNLIAIATNDNPNINCDNLIGDCVNNLPENKETTMELAIVVKDAPNMTLSAYSDSSATNGDNPNSDKISLETTNLDKAAANLAIHTSDNSLSIDRDNPTEDKQPLIGNPMLCMANLQRSEMNVYNSYLKPPILGDFVDTPSLSCDEQHNNDHSDQRIYSVVSSNDGKITPTANLNKTQILTNNANCDEPNTNMYVTYGDDAVESKQKRTENSFCMLNLSTDLNDVFTDKYLDYDGFTNLSPNDSRMHTTTSLVNNLPAFENVILYGDNVNPNHVNKLPDSTGMKITGTNTNVTSTSSLCTDSLNSTDRESFPEHHTAAVNTFSKEYSKGPGAADRDLHPKQLSDTSASSQQCNQDQSHTPTQPDFTVLADNDDQSYATYSSTRGEHIVNSKYQKCDSTNTGYIKEPLRSKPNYLKISN